MHSSIMQKWVNMFYIGVVEDNLDPLKIARLRVRVYGVHTENRSDATNTTQYLLTDELPWAMPALPISNSAINGISDFSTIESGTLVFVFFLDKYQQKPVYFGVCPFVLSEMPDFTKGFSDPTGSLPTSDFLNESSISRLARNEKIDQTCVKVKQDEATTWTTNEVEIDEPEPGYATEYPYNRVIETSSGIIIELDSTPNANRIHIYHPANTFTEIYHDGSKVQKTSGNEFDIVLGDKYAVVKGNLSLKIEGGVSIEVDGATDLTCNGVVTATLKENASINAEKDLTIESSKNIQIIAAEEVGIGGTGNVTILGQNIEVTAAGTLTLSSTSAVIINTEASITATATSLIANISGATTISSGGNVTISAPAGFISLN